MEKNKLGQLADWLLKQKQGKELIEELRKAFGGNPSLPQPKEVIEGFGSAEIYLGYRQGLLGCIKHIELHARGFRDQQVALQKNADKEKK